MKQRKYGIALWGLFIVAGLFVSCTKENKYGLDLTVQDEWAVIGPSSIPPGGEAAFRTRYEEGNKYKWDIVPKTAATITSGDGTYRIEVEVVDAKAFTVTVEVEGSSLTKGSKEVKVPTSLLRVSAELEDGNSLRKDGIDTLLISFNLPLDGGVKSLADATVALASGTPARNAPLKNGTVVTLENEAAAAKTRDGIVYDKKAGVYRVPVKVESATANARLHLLILGTKDKPLKSASTYGGKSFAPPHKDAKIGYHWLGDTIANILTVDNRKPTASVTAIQTKSAAIKDIPEPKKKAADEAKAVELGSTLTTTLTISLSEPVSLVPIAVPCDKGDKPSKDSKTCNEDGQKVVNNEVQYLYHPTIYLYGVANADKKLQIKYEEIPLTSDDVTGGTVFAATEVKITVPLRSEHVQTSPAPIGNSIVQTAVAAALDLTKDLTGEPAAKQDKVRTELFLGKRKDDRGVKLTKDDTTDKDLIGRAKRWSNSSTLFTVEAGVNDYDLHVGYQLRDLSQGPEWDPVVKNWVQSNLSNTDTDTEGRLPHKLTINR